MKITDPGAVHPAWAECFNRQDFDGIAGFMDTNAVFAPQPGLALTGEDNLVAQRQFLAMGLPIDLTVRHVLREGDIALAIVDWTIKGTAADGNEVDLKGTAADVLRLTDQGWKLIIDNPFGTA
jgi:ketosteroid isomerase-like protein